MEVHFFNKFITWRTHNLLECQHWFALSYKQMYKLSKCNVNAGFPFRSNSQLQRPYILFSLSTIALCTEGNDERTESVLFNFLRTHSQMIFLTYPWLKSTIKSQYESTPESSAFNLRPIIFFNYLYLQYRNSWNYKKKVNECHQWDMTALFSNHATIEHWMDALV